MVIVMLMIMVMIMAIAMVIAMIVLVMVLVICIKLMTMYNVYDGINGDHSNRYAVTIKYILVNLMRSLALYRVNILTIFPLSECVFIRRSAVLTAGQYLLIARNKKRYRVEAGAQVACGGGKTNNFCCAHVEAPRL